MESKTDDFLAELEAYDTEERNLLSFELYEEYSQRPIANTIRECRENFEKAMNKKQLLDDVEREVKSFRVWLEETKNLDPTIAYYIAVVSRACFLGFRQVRRWHSCSEPYWINRLESNAYYFRSRKGELRENRELRVPKSRLGISILISERLSSRSDKENGYGKTRRVAFNDSIKINKKKLSSGNTQIRNLLSEAN